MGLLQPLWKLLASDLAVNIQRRASHLAVLSVIVLLFVLALMAKWQ